jgi:anti-sigma-K factor RskA
MNTRDHVFDLLPGFALDCLDTDELILVSEHLESCAECRAELQSYQAAVERLALMTPVTLPPASLKQRLNARIDPTLTQTSARSHRRGFWQRAMPIAAVLLILILVGSLLLLWQRVNQLEAALNRTNLRTINLTGAEIAPYATGLIVLSQDGAHGTLVVDRLPVLDAEHQYQLWLIEGDKRASGAVFSVGQKGYGSAWVSSPEPLGSYSAFGISIEPTGGSPHPTGDKVMGGVNN